MTPPTPHSEDDGPIGALEHRIARQPFRAIPPGWKHTLLPPVASPASPSSGLTALREFLMPSPWVWGGLAALWILAATFGLAAERTARSGISLSDPGASRGQSPMDDWWRRQELISLLLEDRMPVEPHPSAVPRPRSDSPTVRFGRRPRLRIRRVSQKLRPHLP